MIDDGLLKWFKLFLWQCVIVTCILCLVSKSVTARICTYVVQRLCIRVLLLWCIRNKYKMYIWRDMRAHFLGRFERQIADEASCILFILYWGCNTSPESGNGIFCDVFSSALLFWLWWDFFLYAISSSVTFCAYKHPCFTNLDVLFGLDAGVFCEPRTALFATRIVL